ncbi:hypothetical protein WG906_19360, partial [Pedobacter sp. P351]|uniref:hypothetical protein n=1 Tax=Pedobacter superstes TaxID=3133441 RepID=UPI0030ACE7AE
WPRRPSPFCLDTKRTKKIKNRKMLSRFSVRANARASVTYFGLSGTSVMGMLRFPSKRSCLSTLHSTSSQQ